MPEIPDCVLRQALIAQPFWLFIAGLAVMFVVVPGVIEML
jgi:hypothetical protein